ncbi:MAG: hypothetical protein K6T78_12340 [Alicyclobacillus sp.]|nr:hypothetical protein [Alicyclobacillus sp.]
MTDHMPGETDGDRQLTESLPSESRQSDTETAAKPTSGPFPEEEGRDFSSVALVLGIPVVLFVLIALPYILFFRYTSNPFEIWGWSIGCAVVAAAIMVWVVLRSQSRRRRP